jgi:hypothetical protein
MIEFHIHNVGFRVDSVEDLKRLVDEQLLEKVVGTLYSVYVSNTENDRNRFREKNLGFVVEDEICDDDEELDIEGLLEGLQLLEDDEEFIDEDDEEDDEP